MADSINKCCIQGLKSVNNCRNIKKNYTSYELRKILEDLSLLKFYRQTDRRLPKLCFHFMKIPYTVFLLFGLLSTQKTMLYD